LLGGLFVFGGVEHFFILPLLTGIMAARGVPAARAVLIFGSLWQIVFASCSSSAFGPRRLPSRSSSSR
jgi:uncharacterized membrane protein YphA (DoxX/SURF4 family)